MKGNLHKKLTREDKFARRFYCDHARLNLLRSEKKQNKRKFRKLTKEDMWDVNE